jgi:hypothetical protein
MVLAIIYLLGLMWFMVLYSCVRVASKTDRIMEQMNEYETDSQL